MVSLLGTPLIFTDTLSSESRGDAVIPKFADRLYDRQRAFIKGKRRGLGCAVSTFKDTLACIA